MNGEPQPEGEIGTRPRRPGPALVSRIVGAFLCVAAGLKIFDLYDYPPEGIGWSLSLIGSTVELLIGGALILGVRPSVSVPAAGLLFILLATVSLIGAARGIPRCGCLGPVPMPMWVMTILDAAAAAALAWSVLSSGRWRDRPIPVLAAACLGPAFVGLTLGSILYPKKLPVAPNLQAELNSRADRFEIDPNRFRGRPFFLNRFVRIDADLTRGRWKVILTRPWCPRCDRRLRAVGCAGEGDERVAIVQVGGKQDWPPPRECRAVLGYLSGEKTWVFDAPLIFRLADGVVIEEP
jgi:hypothetical protein